MLIDPVDLTATLVRIDTANPAGNETAAAILLTNLLEAHGFAVSRHELAPGRSSIVARSASAVSATAPLALTGHLDTVPFGQRPWSAPPLSAERRGGRLYGRGASDMKAGVAAIVAAAVEVARDGSAPGGLILLLTAAEEIGCLGARQLAQAGVLGQASGLIVAEPTSNRLVVAHKGALHLRLRTFGRTAHGSMPELGENALLRAVKAVQALAGFSFDVAAHPLLGLPSLAVTTMHGGENVNSIPDGCSVTLDIRMLPGMDHAGLLARLQDVVGDDATFDPPLVNLQPVDSDAGEPFLACVRRLVARHSGEAAAVPGGMPYFTDGSVLQSALGRCPTVIVGPGESGQAHQTDEFCPITAIEVAARIYIDIARSWT